MLLCDPGCRWLDWLRGKVVVEELNLVFPRRRRQTVVTDKLNLSVSSFADKVVAFVAKELVIYV